MHQDGQYLLPTEFLILVTVWLLPPLLIGLGVQFLVLRKRLRASLAAVASCFAITVILGIAGFIAVLTSTWQPLKRLNAMLSLPSPYELLLMPVAFLVVALVAGIVGYVFSRAIRPA
jgi:hypothetical protein